VTGAHRFAAARGGRRVKPDFPGAVLGITSDHAFNLPTLPQRPLVVDGGYIAVEFASIFNGPGVETRMSARTWPMSCKGVASRLCWVARLRSSSWPLSKRRSVDCPRPNLPTAEALLMLGRFPKHSRRHCGDGHGDALGGLGGGDGCWPAGLAPCG